MSDFGTRTDRELTQGDDSQAQLDAAQAAMFEAVEKPQEEGVHEIVDSPLFRLKKKIAGGHSRRAWLLLGEKIFSHPRYALVIVVALGLCAFDRYLWVMMPLALFFSVEWMMRLWLQHENRWKNRPELFFLVLDGIATISLFSALLFPASAIPQSFYFRLARLFRGMYLLRMLRIFRFLTHDTFIYSLLFALLVLGLAIVGLVVENAGLYVGVVLLLELLCRGVSLFKVLPEGGRRHAEIAFLLVDAIASIAVLDLIPGLAPYWVALRLIRFNIMLNPASNISSAFKKVAQLQEVRSEAGMLMGVLGVLLVVGSVSVVYFYPDMDINLDGKINSTDYAPFQVLLFVFRLIMDPGNSPPQAFSPWLVGLTVFLVMAGVFFFALLVGLGANVMRYLLRELGNSPLSAREHLMFVGGNEQSIAILNHLDLLCARLRRSFPSVWMFFGKPLPGAYSIGRWLTVREVDSGDRNLIKRFKLEGIQQVFFFLPALNRIKKQDVVDMHHLKRDVRVDGMVVSDVALPAHLDQVYRNSLGLNVVDSASVTARMLYQMHHCAFMPELGIRLLDVVEGETGLFAYNWPLNITVVEGEVQVVHEYKSIALELWLTHCFVSGINLIAAMDDGDEPVLFSDLVKTEEEHSFSDLIAIGNTPALWPVTLGRAFHQDIQTHENPMKSFAWPESWDLNMIFLGWHEGLPAMVEEMALKHHKLTVHVFSTVEEEALTKANRKLNEVASAATEDGTCELNVHVHAWGGLDSGVLVEHLRGCKVIMFYPEEVDGDIEDSLLELWYHQVAIMLAARKAKAKWWTPPKLMVLPRHGGNVSNFVQASLSYPVLETHVGSPDTFHDVFMARRLLNEAFRHVDKEASIQNDKVFRFVDAMLGDSVLVESVSSKKLLINDESRMLGEPDDWQAIYRESLRRGWLLMGYLMAKVDFDGWSAFDTLERAFPSQQGDHQHAMHLLGGMPITEMDLPGESDQLLFCRRGVLKQMKGEESTAEVVAKAPVEAKKEVTVPVKTETAKVIEPTVEAREEAVTEETVVVSSELPAAAVITTQAEEAVANEDPVCSSSEDQQQQPEALAATDSDETVEETSVVPQENVLEGEIMNDSVWPQVADKRLIRVLQKQVEGSNKLLEESSEDGLTKLTEILDMGVSSEVEDIIMAALTDLQNIDRVSQRLNNVKSCLQDWGNAVPDAPASAIWKDEVEKRYVMEEERIVLKEEL